MQTPDRWNILTHPTKNSNSTMEEEADPRIKDIMTIHRKERATDY
jgi:hypothetical protein